jgi:hypothetical protein
MPTPEQQPQQEVLHGGQSLEGMPEPQEQAEQHFKTIAVRVQEGLHAQLSFIAQLTGNSLSDEIRRAIEGRIASAQDDPNLLARAQQAREQIEREAAARTAAIAGFMGNKATTATTTREGSQRSRRASRN